MQKELRVIPKKNYIILGIIILVTILLVYYFFMWHEAYKESKLNTRILDKYMQVINYNELDDYLVENPNTVIYVSVLEDEMIRDFEKKFKKVLKGNEFIYEILYLDVTEDLKNNKIKKEMQQKYNINGVDITKVPSIMVVNDGTLKSIYSVSDNYYDIDRVKLFLSGIVFEEDEING